ncbi:hypothetical protein [Arabidopsis thaliana]|uniref:Putative F-box protein At1g46984 n=3 Tax=Arabidopsis TaxID=3701 RepID=FB36_ARATH|nr:F-box family protein [Arabidopsis thaliana]Q9C627.1 RecName: Full=Putative F-box protein At1g46984 [Arabidopsis thaliana]KAG7656708.1 F-box domain [Arabidopsis suecica]AAG50624.1 hypothetical protein [Arabidopsis thaliana]AEE32133.1 F-box family protein [Arabidopsis thaliana]CAD5314823.1 unnamed protein product [Arabidopsis thaliana]VYS48340.1 unnamed protein product [Arabidopsis thaliana]|eukprot:NP_175150.1 F-box family protein [Arabidopsis thaliana]
MNRRKNDFLVRPKRIRCYTQLSTLPIDLIIEILSRLPMNSIAICRLVSKQWASILQSSDFTESFLIKSPPRPRLLFTIRYGSKWHLFSAPQPRNFDENFPVVATDYHKGFSGNWCMQSFQLVNGFIYLNNRLSLKGKIDRVSVIWNPSTGQQIPLPDLGVKNSHSKSFFGYDPIEKQFKVLCITSSKEHQVLTLGTGRKLSWRKIEYSYPHYPRKKSNGICINGVLYYRNTNAMIVRFDVRSEEFRFVEIKMYVEILSLINYKGKLGVLFPNTDLAQLWVLDDTNKVEWSKHNFVFPDTTFEAIRATDTGEMFCASSCWRDSLYVSYYDLEKESVKKVKIKGIEDKLSIGKHHANEFFIFPNHVENVMVL